MKQVHALLVLMFSLTGLLSGCGANVPMSQLPPQVTLETLDAHGALLSSRELRSPDPVYEGVQGLLASHPTGWKVSVASYKPGPFVVRAGHAVIYCYATFIVIDYTEGGRHLSRRKDISDVFVKAGLARGAH